MAKGIMIDVRDVNIFFWEIERCRAMPLGILDKSTVKPKPFLSRIRNFTMLPILRNKFQEFQIPLFSDWTSERCFGILKKLLSNIKILIFKGTKKFFGPNVMLTNEIKRHSLLSSLSIELSQSFLPGFIHSFVSLFLFFGLEQENALAQNRLNTAVKTGWTG